MSPRPKHTAQSRRRRRRAADRRVATGIVNLGPDDIREIEQLVAAAVVPDSADDDAAAEIVELVGDALEQFGGDPSDNNKGMSQQPEEAVLEALAVYQSAINCACGHAFSDHDGAGGTCGHADGRGTCRCGEFSYPEADPDAAAITTAYVKIRPDLEGFEAEVEHVIRRALRSALAAAAGDVAWGPEDGFLDLLCDVNEQLVKAGPTYYYDEETCCFGPYAVDAAVDLDKVLICRGDDYYVAPITVGEGGEAVLADQDAWVSVGPGWIEEAKEGAESSAMKLRFALRDFQIEQTRVSMTADGAMAPAIPPEHQPAEVVPKRTSRITDPAPPVGASADGMIRWTATFVPEGVLTEDGRAFAPGALILPPDEEARQLPLTLMAMIETSAEGGHDGAKVAGRIDNLWRDGSLVKAGGVFSEEEFGAMIARMVGNGELRGLSVDIAPLEWERGPAHDWFGENGEWIAERGEDGNWITAGDEPTAEDAIERLFGGGEDVILVITKGVIGMATVCPFPAFGQANIALAASAGPPIITYTAQAGFVVTADTPLQQLVAGAACGCETDEVETVDYASMTEDERVAAYEGLVEGGLSDSEARGTVWPEPVQESGLTASAAGLAPERPPVEWFNDPELEELTPLTVTDDGRIFGHAWAWDTCHLSFDACVVAPHSMTDYAYFQLGEVECEGGERPSVGKVTLDTGHAGQRLSRAEATRHYDDTGTVAAYVAFGEDEFGGWFAGSISPDLDEAKLRVLRGATVSGDWRGVEGNLELVALLAVNVPGFPVPRQRELVASGDFEDGQPEVMSLTAAGIIGLTRDEEDEIREIVTAAVEA